MSQMQRWGGCARRASPYAAGSNTVNERLSARSRRRSFLYSDREVVMAHFWRSRSGHVQLLATVQRQSSRTPSASLAQPLIAIPCELSRCSNRRYDVVTAAAGLLAQTHGLATGRLARITRRCLSGSSPELSVDDLFELISSALQYTPLSLWQSAATSPSRC